MPVIKFSNGIEALIIAHPIKEGCVLISAKYNDVNIPIGPGHINGDDLADLLKRLQTYDMRYVN